MNILHKYNGLRRNNSLLTLNIFYYISYENMIVFVKLIETYFGTDILASFTKFRYQGTDTFGSILV